VIFCLRIPLLINSETSSDCPGWLKVVSSLSLCSAVDALLPETSVAERPFAGRAKLITDKRSESFGNKESLETWSSQRYVAFRRHDINICR